MVDEFPVGLGLVAHGLPFGVVAEGLLIGGGVRLANCYFASLSRPQRPSGANALEISDIQEDETEV
jgi:hypothetical protein